MERQIHILPDFTGHREDAICFETHCSPDEVGDLSRFAFEHHGPGYTPFSPGALRMFHERLLLGQDLPSTLILTRWNRLDQLLAAALFIRPDICLEAECTSLVNSIDLLDRFGDPMLAHVPYEHKELAFILRNITAGAVESQAEVRDCLALVSQCAMMVIAYLENGTLPSIPNPVSEPVVLYAELPLVAFEADGYAWDQFYRRGFLCGVWVTGEGTYRISRKSALVSGFSPEIVLARLQHADPEGDWRLDQDQVEGTSSMALEDLVQNLLQLL